MTQSLASFVLKLCERQVHGLEPVQASILLSYSKFGLFRLVSSAYLKVSVWLKKWKIKSCLLEFLVGTNGRHLIKLESKG